jgi:hypothetical protein
VRFACRCVSGQSGTATGKPGHAVEPNQKPDYMGSSLSLSLVYGDHEIALSLPFEAHVEGRLIQLMDPLAEAPTRDRTRHELASRIVDAVTSMLETDVIPPSEKQVKYAVAIARELNLHLPADVLQHRDAMTEFLANHAQTYRRSRSR